MNINLKAAASKKKKSIGFGLNNRKQGKQKSVFNDNSSSSEDDDDAHADKEDATKAARQAFNKELVAEQAALRSRAEKAISSATNAGSNVYDYDAEYESFGHSNADNSNAPEKGRASKANDAKPESKYIQNLLQKAKERNYEREIVMERKIAREQAQEEEANEEYMGKDKFVTKSYKKKLQEREVWLQQEEKKQKREEVEDVTKKAAGAAIMGFYGNLSRIGGAEGPGKDNIGDSENQLLNDGDRSHHEQLDVRSNMNESSSSRRRRSSDEHEVMEDFELEEELGQQSKRIQRLQNIFRARERYLKRKSERESAENDAQ
jgi:coiled-coil domain-containing protein 55